MRDHRLARLRAAADEVNHALGQSGLFDDLDEFCGDGRRVRRRFENDSVAGDDRGQCHTRHDSERKIPRRNYRTDAERNVFEDVLLARIRCDRLFARPAQHLATVELAKIDRLRNIAVGLGPGL